MAIPITATPRTGLTAPRFGADAPPISAEWSLEVPDLVKQV
jgi:hypothetical protein